MRVTDNEMAYMTCKMALKPPIARDNNKKFWCSSRRSSTRLRHPGYPVKPSRQNQALEISNHPSRQQWDHHYYESRVTHQQAARRYNRRKGRIDSADRRNRGDNLRGDSGQSADPLGGTRQRDVEGTESFARLGRRWFVTLAELWLVLTVKKSFTVRDCRSRPHTAWDPGPPAPSARHQTPVVGKGGRIYYRSLSQGIWV